MRVRVRGHAKFKRRMRKKVVERKNQAYLLMLRATTERVWEAHVTVYKNPKEEVKSLIAQKKDKQMKPSP